MKTAQRILVVIVFLIVGVASVARADNADLFKCHRLLPSITALGQFLVHLRQRLEQVGHQPLHLGKRTRPG